MLDLDRVDLGELCSALEDNSPEHAWWLDPVRGTLELRSEYFDDLEEDEEPSERGLIVIDPLGSHEAYADMEDFATHVLDPRARDLLMRAIAGRGAFRRFKDTLLNFPDLREAWLRFHDARMRRRAITWLRDRALIAAEVAERTLDALEEPDVPELGGALDAHGIARAVAADLRELYGSRLKDVLLFGSWARGDAHPESDIDLLVVLDEVPSRRRERLVRLLVLDGRSSQTRRLKDSVPDGARNPSARLALGLSPSRPRDARTASRALSTATSRGGHPV